MPPPHSTRAYRGYWVIQWNKDGPWQILAVDLEHLSDAAKLEQACATIDEWLAPL